MFLTVSTNSGDVKGRVLEINGKRYGVFKALPFAEPPVGKLRFQRPVPKSAWKPDTLDATGESSPMAIQPSMGPPTSEDCLYLNVYTPKTSESDSTEYPVMFWIHGGGFGMGSTRDYRMEVIIDNLVSREVVVVVTNYRLGPLGFWSTKSSLAPGNNGLLDQVEALRWVQNHIKSFGGTPERVTLFGESAGGASVSLLTYSPLTRGLYCGAIMMSGSALCEWATMYDSTEDKCTRFARAMGCLGDSEQIDATNEQKILDCLLSKSPEEITMADDSEMDADSPLNFWSARIDGYFLPDIPEILAKDRPRVPVMIGYNKDEFGTFEILGGSPTESAERLRSQIRKWRTNRFKKRDPALLATAMEYNFIDCYNPKAERPPEFWTDKAVKMKTSLFVSLAQYLEAVNWKTYGSDVYLYSYEYLSPNQLTEYKYRGALHGIELAFLLDFEKGTVFDLFTLEKWDKDDLHIRETMGKLWTNFAKHGNPTSEPLDNVVWEKFSTEKDNYLCLTRPLSNEVGFIQAERSFWLDFLPKIEHSVEERAKAKPRTCRIT